jgi:hypothetical protein
MLFRILHVDGYSDWDPLTSPPLSLATVHMLGWSNRDAIRIGQSESREIPTLPFHCSVLLVIEGIVFLEIWVILG